MLYLSYENELLVYLLLLSISAILTIYSYIKYRKYSLSMKLCTSGWILISVGMLLIVMRMILRAAPLLSSVIIVVSAISGFILVIIGEIKWRNVKSNLYNNE